jgi:hypothetical protein
MKKIVFFFLFTISFYPELYSQANYLKTWATYYGDESVQIYDSTMDSQGNIYIVGKVFFNPDGQFDIATPNAHQTNFGGGTVDGFLVKFNQEGNLEWATYFGGANDDIIGSISIDKHDYVYCLGTTQSTENIATTNAFQPNLQGEKDVFIAKFTPSGNVIWSTYYGGPLEDGTSTLTDNNFYNVTNNSHAIVNDNLNHFYINVNNVNSDNLATSGVFQENKNDTRSIIAKFTDTGNPIWATYYGYNGSIINAIDVGETGLFVYGRTTDCPPYFTSNTYFATPGSHQPTPGSCTDAFVSKFSFDGQRIWSTYYGGTTGEYSSMNGLKCDNGFVYFTGYTVGSNTNIATPNSFQSTKMSASHYLVKFDEEGTRLWGTYVGDNATNNGYILPPKMKIHNHDIFIHGTTYFQDNISTPDSFQPSMNSMNDAFIVKFNPDGQREWGSYFGGNYNDRIFNALFKDETLYLLGATLSQTAITTSPSFQPDFLYNNNTNHAGSNTAQNTFIARFDPNTLSTNNFIVNPFELYPNPNNGTFSIKSSKTIDSVTIYDVLGNSIYKEKYIDTQLNIKSLSKGIYLIQVHFQDGKSMTKKMILN